MKFSKDKIKGLFKGKRKLVIIAAIIVIIVIAVIVIKSQDQGDGSVTATVEKRDMFNELEFAGDVEANETKDVYSVINQVKVTEVKVAEGDFVKEGDVLVELDRSEIKNQIKAKELEVLQTQVDEEADLDTDITELSDLNTELLEGLNPEIVAAQTALHTAQSEYTQFVYKWNKEVENYNNGLDPKLVEAQNALCSAQAAYYKADRDGEASVEVAEKSYDMKKQEYKRIKSEYEEGGSSVTSDDVQSAKAEYKLAKKEYEESLVNASSGKNVDGTAVAVAERNLQVVNNELNQQNKEYNVLEFTKLSAALADAQANYDATVLTVQQQQKQLQKKVNRQAKSTKSDVAAVELEILKEKYEEYSIKAQCDGYISNVEVKVGDTVDSKPLMSILNYDSMKVKIDVDEYDMDNFKVGTPVNVRINSTNEFYDGEVTAIAAMAEKKNDLSFIKITISFTPDTQLSAGIGATVYTKPDEEKEQLAIPSEAINYDYDMNTTTVTVLGENGEETRDVLIGTESEGYTAILDGLTEGEQIVYTPMPEEEE